MLTKQLIQSLLCKQQQLSNVPTRIGLLINTKLTWISVLNMVIPPTDSFKRVPGCKPLGSYCHSMRVVFMSNVVIILHCNAFLFTAGLAIATIGIGKSVANYQQLEYSKQFGPVQVYTLPSEPATGEYTSY